LLCSKLNNKKCLLPKLIKQTNVSNLGAKSLENHIPQKNKLTDSIFIWEILIILKTIKTMDTFWVKLLSWTCPRLNSLPHTWDYWTSEDLTITTSSLPRVTYLKALIGEPRAQSQPSKIKDLVEAVGLSQPLALWNLNRLFTAKVYWTYPSSNSLIVQPVMVTKAAMEVWWIMHSNTCKIKVSILKTVILMKALIKLVSKMEDLSKFPNTLTFLQVIVIVWRLLLHNNQ